LCISHFSGKYFVSEMTSFMVSRQTPTYDAT
jgi:hypothetical protein